MRVKFLFYAFFCIAQIGLGQNNCPQSQAIEWINGNHIRASIGNSGNLFFDGNTIGFFAPYPSSSLTSTIFAQGLWVGGLDDGGNLKIAAQLYGVNNGNVDYFSGPLSNSSGTTTKNDCQNWDKIWKVNRSQIESHIQDFEENGFITNPQSAIFSWPGANNPFFELENGFPFTEDATVSAPFLDLNNDGIYNPMGGEYPLPSGILSIPEEVTWNVFNDAGGIHGETGGVSIRMQIELTTYAYFDETDNPINHTVFASYKITNKSQENLNDTRIALWHDFDLGCPQDDYFGTSPSQNTLFSYNADNIDGNQNGICPSGVNSFGENPPVQAVKFLNKELDRAIYTSPSFFPLEAGTPSSVIEFYHLMNGQWADNSPLTLGGVGYGGLVEVNHVFPDNPNDSEGWSMMSENLTNNVTRPIISADFETLSPGEVAILDVAYLFVQEPGNSNLENVTSMYEQLDHIQTHYDEHFEDVEGLVNCEEDCVWAGDANADGIVTGKDLLAIMMENEQAGTTRNTPLNWSPYDATNWSANQLNDKNQKHADCDGNGIININDFNISFNHYRFEKPDYSPPIAVYPEGIELEFDPFVMDFSSIENGTTGVIVIRFNTPEPVYAISFSIEYDPEFLDPFSTIFNDFNLISRKLTYQNDGLIDYAQVAESSTELANQGAIMLLTLNAKDEYPSMSTNQTKVRFKNVYAIDANGNEIEIGGQTVDLTFVDIVVGTDEIPIENFELFPNPTSDLLQLKFPNTQLTQLILTDISGKVVLEKKGYFEQETTLNLAGLAKGIYYLNLRNEEVSFSRKVLVQ